MSLASSVRKGDWSELEEAWTELILGSADLGPALAAISAAVRRKEIPRCLPLVREHAEMLVGSERAAEGAELLGHAMLQGGSPGELAKPLYRAAEAAWGAEPFWESFTSIADLHESAPDMRKAWRRFQKLLALTPGRVVYHAKGWGLGRIDELDIAAGQARVRFTSGRSDRFPFSSAIEIFEFLGDDDLRTLVVNDPDELERRLAKEPLEVLRWVLERNDRRATQAGIKLALTGLGVAGPRFTAWWRKAKKLAETSEWFELSGPSTRVQVRLLDEASDPAEGMRRQLGRSKNLGEALSRVRQLVAGGSADAAVVAVALETLEELARDEKAAAMPDLLGTWIFLREQRGETPARLRETVAAAAAEPDPSDPSRPPALWSLLARIPGSREQERSIEVLREALGEGWLDQVSRHLPHAAPGMVRGLVEALEQGGRREALAEHYGALLARATRNPALTVRLAERLERDEAVDEVAPKLRRAQCLLQLAVYLHRNAPGDAILTRTRARLTDILTRGRTPLLGKLLADADLDTLRGFVRQLEAGVDRDVDRVFTRVAIQVAPEVFKGDDRPFWEGEVIWTSREGLARRHEELRVLREVKIPENAEAIGKAASYGDLSENSEWEAAIEEQRNLTNRAMELETMIQSAQLMENAPIPYDTVAPGTRVTYRELPAGAARQIELVGPWDVEREGQVSYRSPLAEGMLGCQPGDRAELTLPSGRVDVEVLAVGPLAR